MSDGRRAWADEMEEKAMREHAARIDALGSYAVAAIADEALARVRFLRSLDIALTRNQHSAIDELSRLLEKLK